MLEEAAQISEDADVDYGHGDVEWRLPVPIRKIYCVGQTAALSRRWATSCQSTRASSHGFRVPSCPSG